MFVIIWLEMDKQSFSWTASCSNRSLSNWTLPFFRWFYQIFQCFRFEGYNIFARVESQINLINQFKGFIRNVSPSERKNKLKTHINNNFEKFLKIKTLSSIEIEFDAIFVFFSNPGTPTLQSRNLEKSKNSLNTGKIRRAILHSTLRDLQTSTCMIVPPLDRLTTLCTVPSYSSHVIGFIIRYSWTH